MTNAAPEPSEPSAGDAVDEAEAGPSPQTYYALPNWLRRTCLILAILTAYSQFGILATTHVYRYSDTDPAFVDGASPGSIKAATLLLPSHRMGMAVPERYKGILEEFSFFRDAVVALLGAALGSAGLVAVSKLPLRRWTSRALALTACPVGAAVALLIPVYQYAAGGTFRIAAFNSTSTDTGGRLYYVAHGHIEVWFGIVIPVLVYVALTLWMLGLSAANVMIWLSRSERTSR